MGKPRLTDLWYTFFKWNIQVKFSKCIQVFSKNTSHCDHILSPGKHKIEKNLSPTKFYASEIKHVVPERCFRIRAKPFSP